MTTQKASQLFEDIIQQSRKLKVPGLDIEAVLQGRRKDVEALLDVGRIGTQSAESIASNQVDMLRNALEDFRGVLSLQAGADASRVDASHHAAKRALDSIGELADIVLKSQAAALEVASRRVRDSIEELKGQLNNQAPKPAK